MDKVEPGTPWGILGHRPNVPMAGGQDPWCECGYRWDRKPGSLLVGEHIREMQKANPSAQREPGWLR